MDQGKVTAIRLKQPAPEFNRGSDTSCYRTAQPGQSSEFTDLQPFNQRPGAIFPTEASGGSQIALTAVTAVNDNRQ